MSIDMEKMILRNFFTQEDYMRKVIPFMELSYFESGLNKNLFRLFATYVAKYNSIPSQEAFKIHICNDNNWSDEDLTNAVELLPKLFEKDTETDPNWLISNTETWCQDRALFNAVMESISILDGKHKELSKNALPDILSKALAVTFDNNIGHDYLTSADKRYDFYHRVEERIPFDIDYLNKITNNGLPKKTLNILLAGTGVGKSLFMCHMAAAALSQGRNVLYVTMEMAEERIAERIDANLMDVAIDQIEKLSRDMFVTKVNKIAAKTHGSLIIKEYPTSQAHAGHFRALLNELKLKRKFVPEIIFIDYLNICASSRIKTMGGSINSYSYIKAIAEELRGLAQEFDVPLVSATQTTRSGYSNSDPGLEDTSESFGLPATADLMLALISNDELQALNQVMIKQLKNRYNDPNLHKRFVVGVNRAKMKLYDVENPEHDLMKDIVDGKKMPQTDVPIFDMTPSGKKLNTEGFQV